MPEIALVTTCKGRLHHLRETLPLMVAQGASEVIVVDYGCPDGAGAWVAAEFPDVKVVRVDGDPEFCPSRARNQGAAHAKAEWLAFIDADIKTAPGWVDWMQDNLQPGRFYRSSTADGQTFGTFICTRADFEAISGFDEIMRGWGGEDGDFYARLLHKGAAPSAYPGEFVSAISHGNDERAGPSDMPDLYHNILLNSAYSTLKMHVMRATGDDALSADLRRDLRTQTKRAIVQWHAAGASRPLAIRYTSPRRKPLTLPGGNVLSTDLTLTIHVKHQPPAVDAPPVTQGTDRHA